MKNFIPSILALSILIGLFTYLITVKYLLNSLSPTNSNQAPTELIIKTQLSSDTLFVKTTRFKTTLPIKTKNISLSENLYLNTNPSVLKWIIFHSIILSLAAGSLVFLLFMIYRLKKKFEITLWSKESVYSLFPLFLTIIAVSSFSSFISTEKENLMGGAKIMDLFEVVFNDPVATTNRIVLAYLILGLFPLLGIMVINLGIGNIFVNSDIEETSIPTRYKELKDKLNVFALFSGVLVATSVIGTRLQRNMIAEHIIGVDKIYPDEFIYGYGLSFSLILAFFFLPSLFYLKYLKQKRNVEIEKAKNTPSWIKIGQESIDDLKLLFAVALPLFSSIIQSFFGHG